MAFTRTQMVAAVAGTLSLAVLTGCPASPTATGTPAPGASASAAPAAGGSTAPSTAPTASTAPSIAPSASTAPSTAPSGSAAPSTAPSASAPAPSGEKVIVSGNAYDEEGATVDGALITVKSLDASVPYTATATTTQGSWVVNNVPEGANVEIVATKDGWTSRRRVGSFQKAATGKKNIINFGAAGGIANTDSDDSTGEAYFISDYPEIASTEPATDATGVDNQKLSFKIRMSEALDEDSRDLLVQALAIVPANEGAKGAVLDAPAIDFETVENKDSSDGTSVILNMAAASASGFGYTIEDGSTFLGNSDRDVVATWNAEGTELTFSFDATLKADDNDEAKYQAILVSQGKLADEKIEDADGNQLGTDKDGSLKSYPGKDFLIANAFRESDLAADDAVKDVTGGTKLSIGNSNWASTHDSAVNWEIKRDEVDPKLTGVDVSKNVDNDFRIELTFSEGMAAYNGSNGLYDGVGSVWDPLQDGVGRFETGAGAATSGGLRDLEKNYRFALGDKVGDTEDVNLSDKPTLATGDNEPSRTLNPESGEYSTVGNFGDEDDELEDDFTFSNDALAADGLDVKDGTVNPGEIVVEVDDNNPNTVFIWIKGKANYFANKASEIKAYVEGVKDPAGNAISDNDAEKNQVRGSI